MSAKPTQTELNRQLSAAVYRWDTRSVNALLTAGAELRAMDDDALRWALMAEPWGVTRVRTEEEHEFLKNMLEQELMTRVVRPFNPRPRRSLA